MKRIAAVLLSLCLILGSMAFAEAALFTPGTLDVIDLHAAEPGTAPLGEVSAVAGNAAFVYVKKVIELAMTGEVDILVCNASVQFRCAWNEIPPEEYDMQMNVNFRATFALMQTYIPGMQSRRWGRVLNIGSVQQTKPHTHMAIYAASKCAIASLTENIAKQTAGDGVTVNMLLPGVIATPRNDAALSDPVYREQVLAKIPAGYAGEAQDCSAAALLLCSEEGRYITGSSLYVDGGMHL